MTDIYLTPREREIVRLIASGMTSRQIAHSTHLAYGTVKQYITNAMNKTGTNTRTELAVRVALQERVIL